MSGACGRVDMECEVPAVQVSYLSRADVYPRIAGEPDSDQALRSDV